MRKLAFFDVDMTIFDGYSGSGIFPDLERLGLAKNGLHNWYQNLRRQYVQGTLSYFELAHQVINKLAFHFQGLKTEQVSKLMEDYLPQEKIFPWVSEIVDKLRAAGFGVVLISGSSESFVKVIGRKIGADFSFGSICEQENDIYTGRLLKFLAGKEKAETVKSLIKQCQPQLTFGFGDSTDDVPMLDLLDLVFIHEPHQPEMKLQIKTRKNWFSVNRDNIVGIVESQIDKTKMSKTEVG